MQTQQLGAMTGGSADGTGIRPPPPSDVRGGPVMTRLRAALASARTTRARRRTAAAPPDTAPWSPTTGLRRLRTRPRVWCALHARR